MKKILIVSLIMIGCSGKPMTNEEIIKQVKICNDAGMNYSQLGWGRTETVECRK